MAIQATRVLQHQTRIPNANASSSSTSSASNDANATVQIKHHLHHQQENGIEQDPWIKRREQHDQQIPASTGKVWGRSR